MGAEEKMPQRSHQGRAAYIAISEAYNGNYLLQ